MISLSLVLLRAESNRTIMHPSLQKAALQVLEEGNKLRDALEISAHVALHKLHILVTTGQELGIIMRDTECEICLPLHA